MASSECSQLSMPLNRLKGGDRRRPTRRCSRRRPARHFSPSALRFSVRVVAAERQIRWAAKFRVKDHYSVVGIRRFQSLLNREELRMVTLPSDVAERLASWEFWWR